MAGDLATPAPRTHHARLSTVGSPTCTPEWLALREPADAAARSGDLPALLRPVLPEAGPDCPLRVHDLGAGTGSTARWLAPRLPGPQHWTLHDRDPGLLARAAGTTPAERVEVREGDAVTADLGGADLVVASALLDLLTAAEVDTIAETVADAACPALLTLTVTGEATVHPPHPRDADLAAAFAAHQRRRTERGRLLGPDAGPAAVTALRSRGMVVHTRRSAWRLGPDEQELAHEWLAGWLDAALVARPDLDADRPSMRRAGTVLGAEIGHVDLLALPR